MGKLFLEDNSGMKLLLEMLGAENKAIVQLDKQGRIISQTEGAEKLLQLLPLRNIAEVLSERTITALRLAMENGAEQQLEETIDDMVYTLHLSIYEDGGLLYFFPQEKQNELRRLEMNMIQQTENRLATMLLGTAQGRGEDVSIERKDEIFSIIENCCRQICRSIEHVQMLRRPARPEDLVLQQGDLAELCRKVVERCSQHCPEIRITAETPKVLLTAFDERRLTTALLNLLINAIKAPKVTEITLQLIEKGDHVQIVVRDNGVGLPLEHTKELLEGYNVSGEMTVKTLQSQHTGTGLPLAQHIVAQHGGVLFFEAVEKGTCIRLEMPYPMLPDNLLLHEGLLIEDTIDPYMIEFSVL